MPVPTFEQIDAYEAAPAQIASATSGLSEQQLLHVPAPGEWSIHEVLVHLPDSEIFGFERMRRIIAEHKPVLHAYDEELWGRNLAYRTQDPMRALDLFKALRRSNAALLRLLSPDVWERKGIHTERGEMSLYDIFHVYLEHGNIHLKQIEQVKRSF